MAHLGSPHAAEVDVVFINWSFYSIFSDLLIHTLQHQTRQVYTCQLLLTEFTGIQQRKTHVCVFPSSTAVQMFSAGSSRLAVGPRTSLSIARTFYRCNEAV